MKTEKAPFVQLAPVGNLLSQGQSDVGEPSVWFAHQTARRSWPTLVVSYGAFRAYCERVFGDASESLAFRHAEDLYLCCGCVEGDPKAIVALEEQLLPRVRTALAGKYSEREVVDEVLQALRIKLLVGPTATIGAYAARGSLLGWLTVSAKHLAMDWYRARRSSQTQPLDSSRHWAQEFVDPLHNLETEKYGGSFCTVFDKVIRGLSDEDRQLLMCSALEGHTVKQLGNALCIHPATAARRLVGIKTKLAKALRSELRLSYNWSQEEFVSVAAEMPVRLNATLSVLLRRALRKRVGPQGKLQATG